MTQGTPWEHDDTVLSKSIFPRKIQIKNVRMHQIWQMTIQREDEWYVSVRLALN